MQGDSELKFILIFELYLANKAPISSVSSIGRLNYVLKLYDTLGFKLNVQLYLT